VAGEGKSLDAKGVPTGFQKAIEAAVKNPIAKFVVGIVIALIGSEDEMKASMKDVLQLKQDIIMEVGARITNRFAEDAVTKANHAFGVALRDMKDHLPSLMGDLNDRARYWEMVQIDLTHIFPTVFGEECAYAATLEMIQPVTKNCREFLLRSGLQTQLLYLQLWIVALTQLAKISAAHRKFGIQIGTKTLAGSPKHYYNMLKSTGAKITKLCIRTCMIMSFPAWLKLFDGFTCKWSYPQTWGSVPTFTDLTVRCDCFNCKAVIASLHGQNPITLGSISEEANCKDEYVSDGKSHGLDVCPFDQYDNFCERSSPPRPGINRTKSGIQA